MTWKMLEYPTARNVSGVITPIPDPEQKEMRKKVGKKLIKCMKKNPENEWPMMDRAKDLQDIGVRLFEVIDTTQGVGEDIPNDMVIYLVDDSPKLSHVVIPPAEPNENSDDLKAIEVGKYCFKRCR